jgi:hypothetical protein
MINHHAEIMIIKIVTNVHTDTHKHVTRQHSSQLVPDP